MGEWKTVFEDEIEQRWVIVKVYESADDEDEDDSPLVRVTAALIDDAELALEQSEDSPTPTTKRVAAGNSITLEPDPIEDLEEELLEVGFSPEAAAWIADKVPE